MYAPGKHRKTMPKPKNKTQTPVKRKSKSRAGPVLLIIFVTSLIWVILDLVILFGVVEGDVTNYGPSIKRDEVKRKDSVLKRLEELKQKGHGLGLNKEDALKYLKQLEIRDKLVKKVNKFGKWLGIDNGRNGSVQKAHKDSPGDWRVGHDVNDRPLAKENRPLAKDDQLLPKGDQLLVNEDKLAKEKHKEHPREKPKEWPVRHDLDDSGKFKKDTDVKSEYDEDKLKKRLVELEEQRRRFEKKREEDRRKKQEMRNKQRLDMEGDVERQRQAKLEKIRQRKIEENRRKWRNKMAPDGHGFGGEQQQQQQQLQQEERLKREQDAREKAEIREAEIQAKKKEMEMLEVKRKLEMKQGDGLANGNADEAKRVDLDAVDNAKLKVPGDVSQGNVDTDPMEPYYGIHGVVRVPYEPHYKPTLTRLEELAQRNELGTEKVINYDVTTFSRKIGAPGEKGFGYQPPDRDKAKVALGWREAEFNQFASDQISVERSLRPAGVSGHPGRKCLREEI